MFDYNDLIDRLKEIHVLLLEERTLLETSNIGALEGFSVRKESIMRHLLQGDDANGGLSLGEALKNAEITSSQRAEIERQLESLRQENSINGTLIAAAMDRSSAVSALISSRVPTAVYGEKGRLRGPASGARLARTA